MSSWRSKNKKIFCMLDEEMRQDNVSFAVYALKLSQTYAWDILVGSQIKINIWNTRNFHCSWLSRCVAISSEDDCWSASLARIATICWHCFSIAIRKLTFLLHPVQIHKILKLAFFRFELKCAPIPWLLQNYLLSGLTCPLVGNSSFKSSVFSSLCHSLEPHR